MSGYIEKAETLTMPVIALRVSKKLPFISTQGWLNIFHHNLTHHYSSS